MLNFYEVREAAGYILKMIRASKQSNQDNRVLVNQSDADSIQSAEQSDSDSIQSAEQLDSDSTAAADMDKEQCISWLTEQYMSALIEKMMKW